MSIFRCLAGVPCSFSFLERVGSPWRWFVRGGLPVFAVLIFSGGVFSGPAHNRMIRVLFFQRVPQVIMYYSPDVVIRGGNSIGTNQTRFRAQKAWIVRAPMTQKAGKPRGPVRLRAKTLTLNGRRCNLPHEVVLYIDKEAIDVVCEMTLEGYLEGVVPSEVSLYWPMEALKVQAVIARTYAYYKMRLSRGLRFDVHTGSGDQVFHQVKLSLKSQKKVDEALTRTSDQILLFGNLLQPTFYHSICGGHTAVASEVGVATDGPLMGEESVECSYCRDARGRNWKLRLRSADVAWVLRPDRQMKIGELKIAATDSNGRVLMVEIAATGGRIRMTCEELRRKLGFNKLKSCMFSVKMEEGGGSIEFSGVGWGHGAGLCQWGAYGLAKKGKDYKGILHYYFPGWKVVKMTGREGLYGGGSVSHQ